MLFNSAAFLLFFPFVTLLFFVFPQRVRHIWLLASSWFFYMCWNPEHLPLLVSCTLISYFCALGIGRAEAADMNGSKKKRLKKAVLFFGILLDLGILFYFKYTGFAAEMLRKLFSLTGHELMLPAVDILLPAGISFYTFQAIGYTVDVYRGDTPAERNFIRYALFVSFFPQLVAGPIERSGKLLRQLSEPKAYDHDRARRGFFIMLWGYFLKLVIADRIAVFVNTVYESYAGVSGAFLLTATVLFAVQIYCDFAGYSTIAVGAAAILGIGLTDNFDAPYLSVTVTDFWKRWHISLTSWFRDYVYIPLGGNRKGTIRKYLNIFTVFLLSGLWHGADITYVLWGALNGIYRITDEMTSKLRRRITERLHIPRDAAAFRIAGVVLTNILIDFSWILFRAENIEKAGEITARIFTRFDISSLFDGSLLRWCGLEYAELIVSAVAILILFIADIFKRRGISLPDRLSSLPFPVRCAVTVCAVSFILLFGIYGSEYNAADFIYFRF